MHFLTHNTLDKYSDVDVYVFSIEKDKTLLENNVRIIQSFNSGYNDYSVSLSNLRRYGPFDVIHV